MKEKEPNNVCDKCGGTGKIKQVAGKKKIVGTWGAKPFEDITDYDLDHLDELEKDWISSKFGLNFGKHWRLCYAR